MQLLEERNPPGRQGAGRQRPQGGQLSQPPDGYRAVQRNRAGILPAVRGQRCDKNPDHRGLGHWYRLRDRPVFPCAGGVRQEKPDQKHRRRRLHHPGGILHARAGVRHPGRQGIPAARRSGAAYRRFSRQRQGTHGPQPAGEGCGRRPGGCGRRH